MRKGTLGQLAAVLLVAAVLAACTGGGDTGDQSRPGTSAGQSNAALRVVAGSEQRQIIDEVLAPWCKSKGYACQFDTKGSVDQARLLAGGGGDYDAFWFASDVFRRLGDPQNKKLKDVKSVFTTPVVFAGWKSHMQSLGFLGKPVTTADVFDAVTSGRARTWATNPTQSNSGATAYLGFLSHLAGNGPGKVLTAAQLKSAKVQDGIKRFVRAIGQTPASTDDLMVQCRAAPDQCKSVFTYEALIVQHNKELVAAGQEPFYAVYPQGTLAIADAPLGFLPRGGAADAAKRKVLLEMQQFLLSPEGQEQVVSRGRRPASSIGLTLSNPDKSIFNPDWGIQPTLREQVMRFPAEPVIRQALDDYDLKFRRPVDRIYCFDGSGSMDGNSGWTQMTQGAGGNPAVTYLLFNPAGQDEYMLKASPQDRTTVLLFSHEIRNQWTVEGNDPAKLKGLEESINNERPDGGTAIYDCIKHAGEIFASTPQDGRKRLIVVMSDGQNQDGTPSFDQIPRPTVPVFTVAFGDDADTATLEEIANSTGGQFFADPNDLVSALRKAASYQ